MNAQTDAKLAQARYGPGRARQGKKPVFPLTSSQAGNSSLSATTAAGSPAAFSTTANTSAPPSRSAPIPPRSAREEPGPHR